MLRMSISCSAWNVLAPITEILYFVVRAQGPVLTLIKCSHWQGPHYRLYFKASPIEFTSYVSLWCPSGLSTRSNSDWRVPSCVVVEPRLRERCRGEMEEISKAAGATQVLIGHASEKHINFLCENDSCWWPELRQKIQAALELIDLFSRPSRIIAMWQRFYVRSCVQGDDSHRVYKYLRHRNRYRILDSPQDHMGSCHCASRHILWAMFFVDRTQCIFRSSTVILSQVEWSNSPLELVFRSHRKLPWRHLLVDIRVCVWLCESRLPETHTPIHPCWPGYIVWVQIRPVLLLSDSQATNIVDNHISIGKSTHFLVRHLHRELNKEKWRHQTNSFSISQANQFQIITSVKRQQHHDGSQWKS